MKGRTVMCELERSERLSDREAGQQRRRLAWGEYSEVLRGRNICHVSVTLTVKSDSPGSVEVCFQTFVR